MSHFGLTNYKNTGPPKKISINVVSSGDWKICRQLKMDKSPYISRATLVIAPQRETLWCLRQRRWIIPPKKNPFIFFLVICVTFTLLRSYFSGKKEFQEKEKRKKEKNTKNEGKSLRVRQPDRCPRQSLL